jgi:hypothetical protein
MNNRSINLNGQQHQNLLDQYEKLRSDALNKSKTGSERSSGFSIILLRGMASWMEILQHSELLTPSQNPINHQALENTSPGYPIQKEATVILTNIILSNYKLRSNYA